MTTDRHHVTAIYELDEDGRSWIVHLAEEERAHTYGRTFTQARLAIREAAALWFNVDESKIDVTDQLPPSRQHALDELDEARRRLEADQAEVNARTLDAVRMLKDWCGASQRDLAQMLGLSHQRVQQLLAEA